MSSIGSVRSAISPRNATGVEAHHPLNATRSTIYLPGFHGLESCLGEKAPVGRRVEFDVFSDVGLRFISLANSPNMDPVSYKV